MFEPSQLKISELAHILNKDNAAITTAIKREASIDTQVINNRIVGVSPEGVEFLLKKRGLEYLYTGAIIPVGTNVGGAGKTSTAANLAACARRLTGRDKAVIIIDCDSQGSCTDQVLGDVIPDGEPVLDDYFTNAATLDEVLRPIGDPKNNFWILGSNLDNLYLDRRFPNGSTIRTYMRDLFLELFSKFGPSTKIFVDTSPQLSAATQSIVCALGQLKKIKSVFLVPLRTDLFSMKGAKICLSEIEEMKSSYKGVDDINVQCFLASYDSRLKISVEVMRDVLNDDILKNVICNTIVRYSAEVAKSAKNHESVFSSGKKSNITLDYTDLYLSILSEED